MNDGDSDLSYINEYISCMSNKSANFREYDIYSFGSIVYSFFSKKQFPMEIYDSNNRKESLSFLEEFRMQENEIPPLIRDIIKACWEEQFQRRPPFDEICHLFIEYLKELEIN